MADNSIGVRLDTGIEQILFDDPVVDARLPAGVDLYPSEFPLPHQLDEAVGSPTLDAELLAFLQPGVEDRTILMPARWRAVLAEARQALAVFAQGGGETPSLAGLRMLLEEERSMRDTLDGYRTALFRA